MNINNEQNSFFNRVIQMLYPTTEEFMKCDLKRLEENNEVKQLSLPFEKEGTVYALSNISSSNEKSTFALLWR